MSRYNNGSESEGLSPQAKRLITGCLTWGIIGAVITIVLILTSSSWGPAISQAIYNVQHGQTASSTQQPVQQQPAAQQPVQPSQPAQPILPLPTGPKQTIRLCFVTYDPYDLAAVMESFHNPYYDLVLYPMLFQAEENGPVLTKGSESDQAALVTSGFCDILFTTRDSLASNPGSALEVTTIDRSHGADQIWFSKKGRTSGCMGKDLKIINDLKGCKIAFTPDSVSQFYLASYLKIAAMTTSDVVPVTSSNGANFASPTEAVNALNNNEADAVVCWAGQCPDPSDSSVFKYATTRDLTTIYDVILISHQADQQKPEGIYYALGDWFTAGNMFLADPKGTAEIIANWQYKAEDGNTYPTNWWTGINPGTAYDDMLFWGLDGIAMAKFDQNLIYLTNPELAWENLDLERSILEWGGLPHDENFDPKKLTDFSYLHKLQETRPDLYAPAGTQFLDNSFSPFPPDASTALSSSDSTRVIAEFNCPNVYFGPDKMTIPEGSDQDLKFQECSITLKQIFDQSPGIRLEVVGSSAFPDPALYPSYAQCGTQSEEDRCYKTAKGRAAWALNKLEALGFSGNRISVVIEIGEKTNDRAVMTESRFITIRVLAAGS